jgi:hypothetical protein
MIPREYQTEISEQGLGILRENAMVYLAMEERTGKSLIGVMIVEAANVKKALIITKKKASEDWVNLVTADYDVIKEYAVITYGSIHKVNPDDYDIIILDEAHNYVSCYPKPSSTWDKVVKVTKGKPIIYMSATPHAQGFQMLYHQFALSTWSPWWKYSNFYNWHRTYGIPYTIQVHGKDCNKYDRCNEKLVRACVDHLFITKTRAELNFPFEPKDKLHWVELSEDTKLAYNTLLTDKVLTSTPQMIMADTEMKLRTSLHMMEGGVMKSTLPVKPSPHPELVKVTTETIEKQKLYHAYYNLPNTEKVDYIKATWGDTEDMVIMYNFIPEGIKLRKAFKHAKIAQATSFAEGVDFTHIKHLIVYSQDYSTARHTQRRARQAGFVRGSDIIVNYLLTKKGISHQVYKTVAVNKLNYVDSRFTKEKL